NFVAREASLAVVDLNEALNDAPWSYRFGRFEWVAQRFRLLAGAELLLDETVEGFHCYLHLAVQATVEFLEHAPLGEAVASRTPAFFDAAVVDDTAAMQVIPALAPRERAPSLARVRGGLPLHTHHHGPAGPGLDGRRGGADARAAGAGRSGFAAPGPGGCLPGPRCGGAGRGAGTDMPAACEEERVRTGL